MPADSRVNSQSRSAKLRRRIRCRPSRRYRIAPTSSLARESPPHRDLRPGPRNVSRNPDSTRLMSARPFPLVSILIPAYNAEAWIADTIRSALAQTWTRKEIIVVDDGSHDRTLAIATEFAGAGVSVVAEPHQGAAGTRNRAFALSRGRLHPMARCRRPSRPGQNRAATVRAGRRSPASDAALVALGTVRVPPRTSKVRPVGAMAGPQARGVAAAQDGPEPVHADGGLAHKPRTRLGGGTLGCPAPHGRRRRVLLPRAARLRVGSLRAGGRRAVSRHPFAGRELRRGLRREDGRDADLGEAPHQVPHVAGEQPAQPRSLP